MVYVFDLDDTLYPELTYVHSGFKAVAEWLHHTHSVKGGVDESLAFMIDTESTLGRGQVFDELLKKHNLYNRERVRNCVSVYRSHIPAIKLYDDSTRFLEKHKRQSMYIVTDGNKLVQARKVAALGVSDWVKFSYITYRYGLHHGKPSPYCFLKIAEREKVSPSEVVYFGDNPRKDFVGIKPLGFKTVRLRRGNFAHLEADAAHDADITINSFDEYES